MIEAKKMVRAMRTVCAALALLLLATARGPASCSAMPIAFSHSAAYVARFHATFSKLAALDRADTTCLARQTWQCRATKVSRVARRRAGWMCQATDGSGARDDVAGSAPRQRGEAILENWARAVGIRYSSLRVGALAGGPRGAIAVTDIASSEVRSPFQACAPTRGKHTNSMTQ